MLYKKAFLHSTQPASCRNCRLLSRCLPHDLVEFQLNMFAGIVRQVTSVAGRQYLYTRGDKLTNLYIVRSGSVKRIHHSPDGGEKVARFYFSGELMGIDAIASGRYPDSAVTLETTTLCKLEYAKLSKLSAVIPELNNQLLMKASQELNEEHDVHVTITTNSSVTRVARFMVYFSNQFRLNGYSSTEFLLPMSRWDIGSYLGLANETVSRTLKTLTDEGLITVAGRLVKIRDLGSLKKYDTQSGIGAGLDLPAMAACS